MQHNDANFLKFETETALHRDSDPDIWALRVNIFNHLATPSGGMRPNKLRFGIPGYLAWLGVQQWKAGKQKIGPPPHADFLILVYGTVSKEFDTLQPLVAKLTALGHSVLVLWASEGDIPSEMIAAMGDAAIWHVKPSEVFAWCRPFLWKFAREVSGMLSRISHQLGKLDGMSNALQTNGTALFDYILNLRFWETFLKDKLADYHFKSVALVSDSSPPGEGLTRVANQRQWPTHHFLHGFASLVHSRSLTTDVHCFSSVECEFFIRHDWSPERVHARGHPRQVRLAQKISESRAAHPNEEGLRVLFASQGPGLVGFNDRHYDDSIQCVLKAAEIAQLTAAEFRYRPHPDEDASRFFQTARAYSLRFDDSVLSRRSIADDLAWSNVVITPFSTMAIEACYAGSVLIWITAGDFQFEVREGLIASGYGHPSATAEDLASQFFTCRDTALRKQLCRAFQEIGKKLHVLSDDAAGNSAKIMEASSAMGSNPSNCIPPQ